MIAILLSTIFSVLTNSQLTKDDYYTNWLGTMIPTSDIETYRLIDIILPGSHHAGMYPSAIIDNSYATATDSYFSDVLSFAPGGDDAKLKWSKRQIGNLQDQLNSGSRFLDIRLEQKAGTIYAHHGLLGATLTDMLADIKSYLDASDHEDIIILSFNDFINITPDDVFTTVQTSLSTYMKLTSTYDLTTTTISNLLTNNINIIPIFDGTTTNNYIHSSTTLLTGNETMTSETNNLISNILSQLVTSWDTSTTNGVMNQIFYTLNIEGQSALTKNSNLYASYAEYNADLAVTLANTIDKYSKLYFGNIILVDFIQTSSIIEQVITLNYNYLSCRDPVENWGDVLDCSVLTDLGRDYKNEGVSSACEGVGVALQSDCERSCGLCIWLSGVPGSECGSGTGGVLCDSIVYSSVLGSGGEGVCFVRDNDWESFISDESFCLAPFASESCGSRSSDTCDNTVSGDSECMEGFCNADFQCVSGYCNAKMGVCLEITTPAPTSAPEVTDCYCPLVISDQAVGFREDIEGFRPGDPDGKYEFVRGKCSNPSKCNKVLDENPYIKSLIGFIVIPFIFAIIMFIMYCCCCMCWCTCGNFWKKKCCRCCLGEPEESLPTRWGPTIVMAAILVVILWACIEGMTANQEMHAHIFAADDDSLRTEMLGLFDTVIDKFEGIGPEAEWIVDNIKNIFGSVDGIMDNVDSGTGKPIKNIYYTLNYIVQTYDGYTLGATVTTPFNTVDFPQTQENITLPCDYCATLGTNIGGINDTFKDAVDIVNGMSSMLNSTGGLVTAEEQIDQAVAEFNELIDNFTRLIRTYRSNTSTYLDEFEGYDEQREQGGNWFFMLPLLWIILWVIGVVMGVMGKCNKLGEWCFRCTWCPAMWIGAVIMLVFSFFSIISVGWADFCVNLDEFEADPVGSNLGQTIAMLTGNASDGMDPIALVNACWTGNDLMEVMNLTDKLDWSSFRDNLSDVMSIDVTSAFTLDSLDAFITEINLLNTDEFEVEGDRILAELNAVGANGLKCVCICGSTWGTEPATFTRAKLKNEECYNATGARPNGCWFDVVDYGGLPTGCIANFTVAYSYVQAEVQLVSDMNVAISDIKNRTSIIISAYNDLFGVAVDIEKSVSNISCMMDPIFERFDSIIKNYSNCGFLGDAYGGFKNVGCVLLFTDMYWISCAMMIIAFLSLLVVCMGFMSQYSWHPATEEEPDEDIGSKLVRSASQKFVGTPLGRQMSQRMSARMENHFPRLSSSLRDLQLSVDLGPNDEMNEGGSGGSGLSGGGGDGDVGTQPQPPPPNDEVEVDVKVDDNVEPQGFETIDVDGGVGTAEVGDDEENVGGDGGDLEMPPVSALSAPTDFEADLDVDGEAV